MMSNKVRLIEGNAAEALAKVESRSVDCVVTSPPYFGLRNYETPPIVWQPQEAIWQGCEHEFIKEEYYRAGGSTGTLRERFAKGGKENAERVKSTRWRTHEVCAKCGAERCELGREKFLEDYIRHLDQIMFEVFRTLKSSGVAFLNIGDSYNNASRKASASPVLSQRSLHLVPQLLAVQLQKSGWCIRSEIIWHKTNPPPDPAKSRPARSHETIWVLAKSGKKHYWNAEANTFGTVWAMAVSRNSRHRATMNMALAERCILLGCPEDGIVLDPFMGSGTSVLAAIKMGRAGIGIDIDPANIQMARDALGIRHRPIARLNQLSLIERNFGKIDS